MPSRPVQAAVVQHENKQFPREAPGFTADLSSLQDLWDSVHSQPNVPKEAKLVVETQNPAGGTWWQRWSDVEKLPSEEHDPIKVKAVRKPPPGAAAASPAPAAGKGKKKAQAAGKKGAGAGPPTAGKKAAERAERKRSETPPTPSPRKGAAAAGATFETGEEDYDIVRFHLNDIDNQIAAKDAKLDKVETQLLDSYDNDKKVVVLARIQDRLAATLQTLHEQRTAIVVADIAAAGEEEVDYEETWAEQMMAAIDEEDEDEDVIDDFS